MEKNCKCAFGALELLFPLPSYKVAKSKPQGLESENENLGFFKAFYTSAFIVYSILALSAMQILVG